MLLPKAPGYRAILAVRITLFYCMDNSKATDGMGIYPFSNNYRHLLYIPVYNGSMNFTQYAANNYLGIPRQVTKPLYTALLTYLVKFSNILNDPAILGRFNMVERYLMYASLDIQEQMVEALRNITNERTVQEQHNERSHGNCTKHTDNNNTPATVS